MGWMNGSSKRTTTVVMAFCTMLVMMLPQVSGKWFIVGGHMGWTSGVNYTLWAGDQTFYLGDWLFFVYDRNRDDVLEVNKTNYETCNVEHPVHNYTIGAGRDVVELNVTHDRYFISSKGFCNGGMKLQIHLTPLPPSRVDLTPLPPPVLLAPNPKQPRTAPSKSSSTRFIVLKRQLMIPDVFTIVTKYMGFTTSLNSI